MSWTNPPRTWVAGELVTASIGNTHWRDQFAYLKDAPTFDGNVTVTGTATLTGGVAGTLTPLALVDVSGASAGQIKFPATQNASANANTLDDYEEGTFTPSLGGSGGQSGQAYAVQVGSYVKIGKWVNVTIYLQLSTLGTITDTVQIQGLPFTLENSTNRFIPAPVWFTNSTGSFCTVMGLAAPNSTIINLYGIETAAGTGMTGLNQGDLANTSIIAVCLGYLATA